MNSGYSCTNSFAQSCVRIMSETNLPIVTYEPGTSAAFSYYSLPASLIVTEGSGGGESALAISTFYISAPMIQINFQATNITTTVSSPMHASTTPSCALTGSPPSSTESSLSSTSAALSSTTALPASATTTLVPTAQPSTGLSAGAKGG